MSEKLSILKKYFGYDSFREGQEPVIDSILSGRDVLAVMPTGAGKSVCYQIPAVMTRGITLVVSPLISLMRDQVSNLCQHGIPAAFLNSSLTPRQYSLAMERASCGAYKIIYVAPERLMTDSFLAFARLADISLLAVDEAHCVSQWGHDFRPSYTDISRFTACLAKRPTLAAFTATATEQVKSDIRSLLKLNNPFEVTTGFDRPNLYFGVVRASDRVEYIRRYLDRYPDRSGIIYAMTRNTVERIYESLNIAGYQVSMYHAGLSDEVRAANQEAFIRGTRPVMIATNAFGMGIDKPDVGFIIHYNLPLSMEAYYQEAGRAGRDGCDAECLLLYSPGDIRTAKLLIENSDEAESASPDEVAAAKRLRLKKLNHMIGYCETTSCLRAYILSYFGEQPANTACGKCSSCDGDFELCDITDAVNHIYVALDETGERFGVSFIADYLHGDDDERMRRIGCTENNSFASLSSLHKSRIREIIAWLIDNRLILRSEGQYPVLQLTTLYDKVIGEHKRLYAKFRRPEKLRQPLPRKIQREPVEGVDNELFKALREYRRTAADRRGVPAFCVFTDATLRQLISARPQNHSELLSVSGIGEATAQKYGDDLIRIIREHRG